MEFENEDGEKITMPEPEKIHTYAGWKKLGYQIMKGQKAIAFFHIWKHVKKEKGGRKGNRNRKNIFDRGPFFHS